MEAGQGDSQLKANCIQALGDVHLRQAEYEAARGRYEEALRMRESFFPPEHPDIQEVREALEEVARAMDVRPDAP